MPADLVQRRFLCHDAQVREHLPAPIIVTATLPSAIFAAVDALRREYFPPERNILPAHLTMFHSLPPSCEEELRGLLADLGGGNPPAPARLSRVVSLGRGTAIAVESDALMELRGIIADRFANCLTAQDRHHPRFHITIQNKVSPHEARIVQKHLAAEFMMRDFQIPALEAHSYRGGPWENVGRWQLRGRSAHAIPKAAKKR